MDIRQKVRAKLSDIYIHYMGDRQGSSRKQNSGEDSRRNESGSKRALGSKEVNDDLREVKGSAQGLDQRVLVNVLSLLHEAEVIHSKDPFMGHELAERVLLQCIDNKEVTEAFRRCC